LKFGRTVGEETTVCKMGLGTEYDRNSTLCQDNVNIEFAGLNDRTN
jgi:hypothetical protein